MTRTRDTGVPPVFHLKLRVDDAVDDWLETDWRRSAVVRGFLQGTSSVSGDTYD